MVVCRANGLAEMDMMATKDIITRSARLCEGTRVCFGLTRYRHVMMVLRKYDIPVLDFDGEMSMCTYKGDEYKILRLDNEDHT